MKIRFHFYFDRANQLHGFPYIMTGPYMNIILKPETYEGFTVIATLSSYISV